MSPAHDPSIRPREAQLDGLARALRRDAGALGAWYEAAWPLVHRLCRGFLADGPAGDDAAQDAMLRLVDQLERWDEARPYAAWQRSVVLNLCRSHLRARARRAEHEEAAAALAAPRPLPDPADAASGTEVRALVLGCLGRLAPREREAFVLVDLEGLEPREAAEAMGVTGSTVRSALSLARRRVRDALAPRLAGGHAAGGTA